MVGCSDKFLSFRCVIVRRTGMSGDTWGFHKLYSTYVQTNFLQKRKYSHNATFFSFFIFLYRFPNVTGPGRLISVPIERLVPETDHHSRIRLYRLKLGPLVAGWHPNATFPDQTVKIMYSFSFCSLTGGDIITTCRDTVAGRCANADGCLPFLSNVVQRNYTDTETTYQMRAVNPYIVSWSTHHPSNIQRFKQSGCIWVIWGWKLFTALDWPHHTRYVRLPLLDRLSSWNYHSRANRGERQGEGDPVEEEHRDTVPSMLPRFAGEPLSTISQWNTENI